MKTASLRTNIISLKFNSKESSDFYATVDKIKAIEGRKYQPNTKSWSVPLNMESIEAVCKLGFDISNDIISWMEFEKRDVEQIQKQIENIKFQDNILYDYQVPHAKQLIHSLIRNDAGLDASETGTGKTYSALSVAKYFKLIPVILVPKSGIQKWKDVGKLFKVGRMIVYNYEQYQRGNVSHLTFTEKDNKKKFTWNTNEKHLIIFDEVHRCKNSKTINSQILRTAKKSKSKILALSATVADNPLQMYSLGLVLGIFRNSQDYWRWSMSRGVKKGFWGMEFKGTVEILKKIHQDIFPDKGSRIIIKELGDAFPDNLVISDTYEMNETSTHKIQELYKELGLIKGLSVLTERLRIRQSVELLKIPTIIEMVQDLVEEGCSVAIFVNFKESIKMLSEKLKTKCIIDGSNKGTEREDNRLAFQSDKERVIICNIKAGKESIDLHDITGKHNRVSLISPTDSAQDLKQTLGRIHRAGAKSTALQKIIFCAGTVEEDVAENVRKKLDRIDLINDGELSGIWEEEK